MGRSRKDALAADGSGDPAPAQVDLVEEEDIEEQQSQEEKEEGDGEEGGEEEAEEQEVGVEASGKTAEQEKAAEGSPPKLAEGYFEIEAIRRRRRRRGQLQYLVKWRGWPESANTWEASGETAEQEKAAEGSPPKLAEGYFEIEAIRRRRRHRGQLQYLVKWRGWPESANTWEPFENLKDCSDIIDAFEKRPRSPRSSRKRKRKTTTTPTTDPNPSRGKRGRPPRSEAGSLPRPPAVPKVLPCRTSSRRACNNANKTPLGGLEASVNGLGQRVLEEGSSGVVSAGFPSEGRPLSVSLSHQQDEQHPMNALPKVGSVQAPLSQGGQVTGAKKRKSGCVRRFKLDEATQEQGDYCGRTAEKPSNEYVDSTEGEIVDKNKGEEYVNKVQITKIIKPVRYFASIMDGVQQVSITFKALKSDGMEVLVDDKELKAKQPLVLIDYYEQHLRYNPTS